MKNSDQKKLLVASYLLNPGERIYNIEELDFGDIEKNLKDAGLWHLFLNVEVPLIYVLDNMEKTGVKIDTGYLEKMSKEFEKDLKKLTQDIYKLAGEEFNINSPQQLKNILFEKLKISTQGVRRTFKTGALSTSARELVKLQDVHPIIKLIIIYRELQKLKSTYIDALPKLVDKKTNRIHTSFNQTITATGRLSSSNPNLQNIPVRSEYGKEIRKAFVAERGNVLLALDYSQIELRVVAHLADDKKMIEAFNAGIDIHTRTAAEVWGVELKNVTKNMRRAAKAINFGITYGMGARALAEAGGMSVQEAQEFIGRYFSLHQGIKNYIDETKALARSMGYVETLFGRRRYLPEIVSMFAPERASAERMAINHPVQGTAADIIKMAMIEIDKKLKYPMIMQVHDELIFEVSKKDAKKAIKEIKEIMENVVKLKVPILVDINIGNNWGEMEKL